MSITDPILILILLVSHAFLTGVGYCIGSTMRDARAKRERMQLWKQAEQLYRDRAIIDARDDAPLQNFIKDTP